MSDTPITIGPADKELLCQRCVREYPVWFCPNELWNQVQREGEHFFCPTCFAVLAEERGIKPTAWFLRQENDEDRASAHQVHALRDRVTALTEALKRARKAVETSRIALDDWLHIFVPEECSLESVIESRERVNENGTIYYIATVQEQNRNVLADIDRALYRGEEEKDGK